MPGSGAAKRSHALAMRAAKLASQGWTSRAERAESALAYVVTTLADMDDGAAPVEELARRARDRIARVEAALAEAVSQTVEKCAKACIDPTFPNEADRNIQWKCHDAIRTLAPTITAEAEAMQRDAEHEARYKAALDKIASWQEGDTVTSSFDEPNSARIARQALTEGK